MRYEVRKSIIRVVGTIWQPFGAKAAYTYNLYAYDLDKIDRPITRRSVSHWLSLHAGDFEQIIDFYASLEVGDDTIEIPWADEDNEMFYYDCLGEDED